MARRRPLLAAAALLGCAFFALSCGHSGTEIIPTTDWVTFAGDSISVMLPSSFEGGDHTDPEVIAALEELAASNPNPDIRKSLESVLESVKHEGEFGRRLLIIWGQPDKDGYMPTVDAGRVHLLPGPSLGDLVEYFTSGYPEEAWSLENLRTDEARVVLRQELDNGRVGVTYSVYLVRGLYAYEIAYSYMEDDTSMRAISRASADTIVIEE